MPNEAHEELMRQRYLADLVTTASPIQRLLMLFDYLRRDLNTASEGFEEKDWKKVSDALIHAQHIIFALRDPLDRSAQFGASLGAVYDFCLRQLIECNLKKDPSKLPAVRELLDRIATANATAASELATSGAGKVAIDA